MLKNMLRSQGYFEVRLRMAFILDKLKKTGFQLTGNMEREIEQTLSLCENFANKN